MKITQSLSAAASFVVLAGSLSALNAAPKDYYRINVVDDVTGRGVPLVELTTVNQERFYTDSNGVIALNEPDLAHRKVWFSVSSDGYEFPEDGFHYRGIALNVVPGSQSTIKIHRVNIAERLYRITGAGIYRDSVLLGLPVPISHPLMDGDVMGQDTVMAAPYRGKLYWFYGDTQKPSYPLGQFATSGATSLLPGAGGLDPDKGINLDYWVDSDGFSKQMLPLPGFGGPVWVGGLFTLGSGNTEHLYTRYAHLKNDGSIGEQGLAVFDDQKNVLEKVKAFDIKDELYPDGQPFKAKVGDQEFEYFEPGTGQGAPLVRCQANLENISNPQQYQGYTCLSPGERFNGANTKLERDASGNLVYGWKFDTPTLSFDQVTALTAAGTMKPSEALIQLHDVDTGAVIHGHGGSVFWNPYRKRWVMVISQAFGKASFLGELWFSEADTPVGPWVYAKQIVTHNNYTFYNPAQHPFFNQDGGRLIYFEGTYTDTYSGAKDLTPRYNYNQMMYRLALDDPRLSLPEPVYVWRSKAGTDILGMRGAVELAHGTAQIQSTAFFAVPPSRKVTGLIPIYSFVTRFGHQTLPQNVHIVGLPPTILFFAMPKAPTGSAQAQVVPLYEFTDPKSGLKSYHVTSESVDPGLIRAEQPLCWVWKNPSSVLALDWNTIPETPK